MSATDDIFAAIQDDEVNSNGYAAYYLEYTDVDKNGFEWISLMKPSIARDRWFRRTNIICYKKPNPQPVACTFNPDWKKQQILMVAPDKRVFIAPHYGGKAVQLTADDLKNGLTPLGSDGKPQPNQDVYDSGSGGGGEGGSAPFGLPLPFFNAEIWDKVPKPLLWLLVANGGYQVAKKSGGKTIGLIGGVGVVGGIYGAAELMRRKKK